VDIEYQDAEYAFPDQEYSKFITQIQRDTKQSFICPVRQFNTGIEQLVKTRTKDH
jgi:hypothetical protein